MDVRLPRLGEGADSGTVAGIFVKEGDRVKKDQPVLELESDKAVASIPSPAAGTVTKIHVKEGDEIKVGQLILSLEGDGARDQSGVGQQTQPVEAFPAEEEIPEPIEEPEMEVAEPAQVAGVGKPASPSVRKVARELGIDLNKVKGSERGGRIVLEDLRRYLTRLQQLAFQHKAVSPEQAAVPKVTLESIDFSKWGPVVKKPMSALRRTIKRRMVASWTTVPHITQFDEADITQVMALRKKYADAYEKKGGHLTLTVFALKAVVNALKKHPKFNASIDEVTDEVVFKEYFHIGVAVDTEEGLIVPVVRDVDKKTMLELSIELQELAERTRRRKVSLEEMQGGTFTISNQGGIGSAHFTPIINKPEVAILGIGRGVLKPVVVKNEAVQRMMLPVCLSYDHRLIDGADAARFMVDLVEEFGSVKDTDANV